MRHKFLTITIIACIMMCSAVLSARALPFMYVMIDGVQSGPFDWDTLKKMVAEGKLTERTLVWKEGMDSWTPAEEVYSFEVEGLFRVLYYAMINGEQKGPYNKNGLRGLSDNKQLTKDTLVWSEKMDSWKPAGEISVLADLFEEKPKTKTSYNDNNDEEKYDYWASGYLRYALPCLVGGSVSLIGGAVGMPFAVMYLMEAGFDSATGSVLGTCIGLALAGVIFTPLSAIWWYGLAKDKAEFDERHEKKRSLLKRSSIGGGYNWDKKEVTVAMAIRL